MLSKRPPRNPAILPTIKERKSTNNMVAKTLIKDILVPYIILENTSLPKWSVPKIWLEVTGANLFVKSTSYGLYGAINGANNALNIIMASNEKSIINPLSFILCSIFYFRV